MLVGGDSTLKIKYLIIMATISELIQKLETFAPFSYQESYDNSGLIVGNYGQKITSAIITLDTTEEIVDEAIENGANLIISHHPIIFRGLKTLTGKNYVERTIIKAIKNNIAILAVHTNLDNILEGVNSEICKKLNLKNCKILLPKGEILKKLVTFVPEKSAEQVKNEIFKAGAGNIGNYDSCSFNTVGNGTFRANEKANPYVGEINKIHTEQEVRIETIFPAHKERQIINSLLKSHPYEEVAYDIYKLENKLTTVGSGMIGELENSMKELDFLKVIKKEFEVGAIKHTKLFGKKIKKVALCGGAGSFLLKNAMREKADIFISGDFSYHQFFDAENKITIADIGHYESEQYTKQLLLNFIKKNFTTFDSQISKINTNPIQYF